MKRNNIVIWTKSTRVNLSRQRFWSADFVFSLAALPISSLFPQLYWLLSIEFIYYLVQLANTGGPRPNGLI